MRRIEGTRHGGERRSVVVDFREQLTVLRRNLHVLQLYGRQTQVGPFGNRELLRGRMRLHAVWTVVARVRSRRIVDENVKEAESLTA